MAHLRDQTFDNCLDCNISPCHRLTPLYAKIASACISVEADVWHIEGDLYVGHDAGSLTAAAAPRKVYLDPLLRILEATNAPSTIGNGNTDGHQGVFAADPFQILVLLIDIKSNAAENYLQLDKQLQDLRDANLLTHWNGTYRVERPITVVVSGNASFGLIVATNETQRGCTIGAFGERRQSSCSYRSSKVLSDALRFKYNPNNSWYASSQLKSISLFSSLTAGEAENLGHFVNMAAARGLKSRYWGTPRWLRSLRDQVWETLFKQGTSILNVDDLRAARQGSWGRWGPR
ncbi:hypothetical protein E4T42_02831 [Aureobasidium subglaciale]|nr:hypothetical protein E4T42_02831 [Aureobasidium subglaciale]